MSYLAVYTFTAPTNQRTHLERVLFDRFGSAVSSPLSGGFTELDQENGGGVYLWTGTIPDEFIGCLVFRQQDPPNLMRAYFAINTDVWNISQGATFPASSMGAGLVQLIAQVPRLASLGSQELVFHTALVANTPIELYRGAAYNNDPALSEYNAVRAVYTADTMPDFTDATITWRLAGTEISGTLSTQTATTAEFSFNLLAANTLDLTAAYYNSSIVVTLSNGDPLPVWVGTVRPLDLPGS